MQGQKSGEGGHVEPYIKLVTRYIETHNTHSLSPFLSIPKVPASLFSCKPSLYSRLFGFRVNHSLKPLFYSSGYGGHPFEEQATHGSVRGPLKPYFAKEQPAIHTDNGLDRRHAPDESQQGARNSRRCRR